MDGSPRHDPLVHLLVPLDGPLGPCCILCKVALLELISGVLQLVQELSGLPDKLLHSQPQFNPRVVVVGQRAIKVRRQLSRVYGLGQALHTDEIRLRYDTTRMTLLYTNHSGHSQCFGKYKDILYCLM